MAFRYVSSLCLVSFLNNSAAEKPSFFKFDRGFGIMEEETGELEDRTKEVIEEQLLDSDLDMEEKDNLREQLENGLTPPGIEDGPEKPEMKNKQNEMDEKVERESGEEIPGPWNSQEIEYLSNNRHEMSNEEMKEFLEGRNEIQKHEWSPFSRSEERFMLQNHGTMPVEDMAEALDREKRSVELQLALMGVRDEP